MKTFLNIVLLMFLSVSISTIASDNAIAPSHDISYPEGWQDWATIAVSHRTDNNMAIDTIHTARIPSHSGGVGGPVPSSQFL